MNRQQRRAAAKSAKRSARAVPARLSERHLNAAGNVIGRFHEARIESLQEILLADRFRQQLNGEQKTDIGIASRIAFNAIADGTGSEDDWNTVVCSLNIALVLCERGFGNEYVSILNESLDGAFRAKLRFSQSGKWGFDGPARQAIKDAFEVHEAQLEIATQAEVMSALGEVHSRIDSGNVYRENKAVKSADCAPQAI